MLYKFLHSSLVFSLFLLPLHAFADRLLPTKPLLRPEGVQQLGNSCHATAFLTALEHHFQRTNKPVKLSLLYLIYSMRFIIDKSDNKERVVYDPAYFHEPSVHTLEKHGSIIPHFMHPEEHRFTNAYCSRPQASLQFLLPPSDANIPDEYHVEWPTLKSHILANDLTETFPMFLGSNGDPVQVLKDLVSQNKVAILAFSGQAAQKLFEDDSYKKSSLLERMLLQTPDDADIQREVSKKLLDAFVHELMTLSPQWPGSHSLALVGFDDSLYQNYGYASPGGFILKGTWDDSSHEYASIPYQVIRDLSQANKQRALDFTKRGESGSSIFLLKLQLLELPPGFEDKVYRYYENYKNDVQYKLTYFPFLAHLFLAEKFINRFHEIAPRISSTDLNDNAEIRKAIVSFFSPWEENILIHIALLSGEKINAMIDSKDFSKVYKVNPELAYFPEGVFFHFLKEIGEDFSYLDRNPSELAYWQGFFALAKTTLVLLKPQQQQKEEL